MTSIVEKVPERSDFEPPAENFQRDPGAIDRLLERYRSVRDFSEKLCVPLEVEDQVIQSMPDASPTKWHLLHTTWFFETFVLREANTAYKPFHPLFEYLYNSYYNAVGEQFPRTQRGNLSRPTVGETWEYRRHVDDKMVELLSHERRLLDDALLNRIAIGLHHEQQHQELMLTDVKTVLCNNPLHPRYAQSPEQDNAPLPALEWIHFGEGLHDLGHDGPGFCYDNETPRHRQFLEPLSLADRLVTNTEYLAFMRDGGYENPLLWLSEGWGAVAQNGWRAPLYWEEHDGTWWMSALNGHRQVVPNEPVCHISYYEADAYARWADARLPSEFEWEVAAREQPGGGNFVESGHFHPRALSEPSNGTLRQCFGDVWEWTRSSYAAYPGYAPADGALGEYNGKFMCNQYVLRGGSCATSARHIRPTYRNFFPASARWQFSGVRIARER